MSLAQPLSKPTYSEQVVSLIKQRIRSGKMQPGERISEAVIATECGISRAPVREALYVLEGLGLLTSHPKRGKIVTTLTTEEITNRYELAGLLEGAAAVSAVSRMTDAHWEELTALLEAMRVAVQSGSGLEEHADIGTRFHEGILSHAANPLIASLARKSCRIVSKYLLFQCWKTLYTPEELYDRHLAVYNALTSRDTARIEETMRGHYAESGQRMADMGRERLAKAATQVKKKRAPVFPKE